MMRTTLFRPALVLLGFALAAVAPSIAQQAADPAALPPLSYICLMAGDEGVLETKPGICPNPQCKMALVPVRLDSKFWCPVHQTLIVRPTAGKCPLDKRDLVPVTLSHYWTCPDQPDIKLLEPGNCANGQPRKVGYDVRAHGDHNPRHGGQFFMASDSWHHLEGTHPQPGLFRLYFYDNFTKPMPVKDFKGRVVLREERNPATGVYTELEAYPLRVSTDGTTMDAQVPNRALPLVVTAKVTFGASGSENRFDFTFHELSREK